MAIQSCLIVGAGISGLVAARQLGQAGVSTVLLDKGKKPGGRMASRHQGNRVYDTGAQFFTVRSPRFQALLDEWTALGAVAQWGRGFPGADARVRPDGHPRYRAVPYMRALCEHLAKDLDVRCSERATQVEPTAMRWQAGTDNGARFEADALIMTLPVPQALELLEGAGAALPSETIEALRPIAYDPCIALMVELSAPSAIPEPGGIRMPAPEILWMADNQAKGVSPEGPCATIHAAPEFSRTHFQSDSDQLATLLLGAAHEYLGGEAKEVFVHRWRYSQPIRCHSEECLLADVGGAPLVFAGDAFGAPRVEGAALSGLAAAARLLA